MKNTATFLSALSLVGVIALFALYFSHNKTTVVADNTSPAKTITPVSKIAYVNIDSLEAHYELMKTKKEEFKNKQDQMDAELQRSYAQMQDDAAEVQKKADEKTLSQDEYESAQKRLMQEQQSLETRRQALSDQLAKEQEDFNKDLKLRIDKFLVNYNKDKNYDYILTYSYSNSPVLYANKQLDITQDVINGMNALDKDEMNKKK